MHRPRSRVWLAVIGATVLVASLLGAGGATAGARANSPIRSLGRVGPLRAMAAQHRTAHGGVGLNAVANTEISSPQVEGQEPEGGEAVANGEVAAPKASQHADVAAADTPGVLGSWEGSNHFDSRYSNNGNQFSGEPPDQGICANDSRVFEIVNSVVQVYTTSGTPLIAGDPFFPGSGPVGLTINQFLGIPPALVRTDPLTFGSDTFDVWCEYDASVNRWFVTADYLDLDHDTGAFAGDGGVYLAVSTSGDPLGTWNIWNLRTMNNGTEGTPNHHCSGGYCYSDFPHFGVDANGLYLTANEFDLLGQGEFHGAEMWAFSKADLVAGDPTPQMEYFSGIYSKAVNYFAYSVEPVLAQPADFVSANGGTMYFGMSQSPLVDGAASAVSLWRLTNTSSLNTTSPDLALSETSIPTGQYAFPVYSLQAPGPTPLLDCANKFRCIGTPYPHELSPLPVGRVGGEVQGAWLHDGVVYLTTTTALEGPGGASWNPRVGKWKPIDLHNGVAYVALRPSTTSSAVSRVFQGAVDVPGENLIFPEVAMNAAGDGAIGVTLVGPDTHPSAAYIPFTRVGATTNVYVSGEGVGPNDGFTGTGEGGFDPRWGDYGAATVSPNGTIWLANEYIAQSCAFAEWIVDSTCGYTRTLFANWSTRITAYKP